MPPSGLSIKSTDTEGHFYFFLNTQIIVNEVANYPHQLLLAAPNKIIATTTMKRSLETRHYDDDNHDCDDASRFIMARIIWYS